MFCQGFHEQSIHVSPVGKNLIWIVWTQRR
jgi:hypothetical protein